ncbi:MAG: hypothetical protein ACRBN8_28255 [Nannocystales bacterium]
MRGLSLSPLTFGVLLAATLAQAGCAKRTPLSPKELAKVTTEAGIAPLRVYTERKMIALYNEASVDESFNVDRKITEESDKVVDKQVTTRNTAGLILDIDELNGKPLLFVTFDASCKTRECAYQFVETEDGRYRLVELPDREGYDKPRTYRACVWKKRKLGKGKLASLAEANEVYLVKKNNGKILTMTLEVKKVTNDRTQTRTRRNRGIE